eukprot:TRINITY_DN45797_c1_g2_i1.p1 TRINITY_DN45797_c1_g2~~TRINITY_DN45797_c1_g2_i1.p1  ORF type:complete len:629 (-),score=153.65 TRINITY_DN45797_c1_g2_i1:104-1990(-)
MSCAPPWTMLLLGLWYLHVAVPLASLRSFDELLFVVPAEFAGMVAETCRTRSLDSLWQPPKTSWRLIFRSLFLWRFLYRFFTKLCPQIWQNPTAMQADWYGRITRVFIVVMVLAMASSPFMVTSAPFVYFLQFMTRPWLNTAYRLMDREAVGSSSRRVDVFIMALQLLKVLRYCYMRRQERAARQRLDEIVQWSVEHPFYAELEESFGRRSSSFRPSILRGISRTLTMNWSQERAKSLLEKQRRLNEERRQEERLNFGGPARIPDRLRINLRRETLWEDTRDFLLSHGSHEFLTERLYVEFESEVAVDLGGVTKDWFDSVARHLTEDAQSGSAGSIFVEAPDGTLMPRPVEDPSEQGQRFRDLVAVGRFTALAILQEVALPLSLSLVSCKLLLRQAVGERDVRQVDPQFYRGRVEQVLREGGPAELAAVLGEPLTFMSAPTELRQEPEELKLGGAAIEVTEANKVEYVQLLCETYLCGSVRRELQCMLQGFWELLPPALLAESQVKPRELAMMISGFQELDPDDWREHSRRDEGEIHDWFWEVVKEMSQEERCMLLHFATGSSRLPLGGFQDLDPVFKVDVSPSNDSDHLPHAHTCFNQLVLMDYKSKEQLQAKLLLAVKQGAGFGFA